MNSGGLWPAMAGNPVRFLFSWWPWRCLAYLVSTVAVASVVWGVILPGLLFPPVLVLLGLPVGGLERRRLRLLERVPASPHTVPPPGAVAWLKRRVGEAATWRELGYMVCLACVLVLVDLAGLSALLVCALLLGLPLLLAVNGTGQVDIQMFGHSVDTIGKSLLVATAVGLPATVIAVYVLCVLAGGQAAFTRWLLAPTGAEVNRSVAELAESRARLVDAFDAERRRIERDLHDGAQQHLVLLTMNLGLAELELGADGTRAGGLVAGAHRQARQALAAMRELIHGIHPQVLTDLGLAAAVGELAERCRVAVDVDIALDRRLPDKVESTAYFVVSEALTNAVRHAGAGRITVTGRIVAERLVVTITDGGTGGAEPARGSGLRGLVDRTAALSGTLTLTSPVGGPTTVRMELPCRSG